MLVYGVIFHAEISSTFLTMNHNKFQCRSNIFCISNIGNDVGRNERLYGKGKGIGIHVKTSTFKTLR